MGAMDDVYGGMDPYDNGGPFMNPGCCWVKVESVRFLHRYDRLQY